MRALLIIAIALAAARSADLITLRVAPVNAARSESDHHLLALSARHGRVERRFPQPEGGRFPSVSAIEPDGDGGWFLSGTFDSVGGVGCPSVVHLFASGEGDRDWCPRPDGDVSRLARAGDSLYVTGNFSNIGGKARDGFAELDAATGHVRPWQPQQGFRSTGVLAADTSRVFLGGGGLLTAFDRGTGQRLPWNARFDNRGSRCTYARRCDTDLGAILVRGNSVYVAGNFRHVQGQKRIGLAALDARGARLLPWRANLNEDAVTSIDDVPRQLAAAGQTVYVGQTGLSAFERIGGVRREGFAALDARTGAVRRWLPRLPRYEQKVWAFAVSGSTFVVVYDYTTSQYSDIFLTAVRVVDRATGQKVRWTHTIPGDHFYIPFARIGGTRVLVDYY